MIKVSLIIATYNRADSLKRTLYSLVNQSLSRSLFEILVIDNNCVDHTAQVCDDFCTQNPAINLRRLVETAQGLSHARNCGFRNALGDYYVVIDDDETVNDDFLKAYYDFFESHPDVTAAGGVIEPLYEYELPSWSTLYTERPIAGNLNLGDTVRPFGKKTFPGGGNLALRRTAVRDYGAFNPELGRNGTTMLAGEEKDLFQRLKDAGQKIYYVPGAIIYHIIPQSRMTREYLLKNARMVGVSERIRTQNSGAGAYFVRLCGELMRWAATIVLFIKYLFLGTPIKGWYLILMRAKITQGLLNIS